MSTFVIPVIDVDEDGKDYSFPVEASWLDRVLADADLRADPEAPPGELSVHVQKNGKELLLTGHVHVGLVGRCVRCLEDAKLAIDTDITALLEQVRGKRNAPPELELSAEDLDRGTYSGDELVLDDLVREQLVVEVPMQPVCREDCKGLQVPAHIRPPDDFGGKEQGVDPRLSPLLKLKDKVLPNKE